VHKQTDKQIDRHYENNGHLAVNQLAVNQYFDRYTDLHEWDLAFDTM